MQSEIDDADVAAFFAKPRVPNGHKVLHEQLITEWKAILKTDKATTCKLGYTHPEAGVTDAVRVELLKEHWQKLSGS